MGEQHEFAVEYETCKICYLLVYLASGTKYPCILCGQCTNKRVEQPVHLRLEIIYKVLK